MLKVCPVCPDTTSAKTTTTTLADSVAFPMGWRVLNKKLSYRKETARQLPTRREARPSSPLPLLPPSGYMYAYGRIRNPQQTYVKCAVH